MKRGMQSALAAVLALGLATCGDDSPTSPTPPPPDVAGTYQVRWTLEVLRLSDGFRIDFRWLGGLTLAQGPPSGRTAPLTGSAVVYSSTSELYDLAGTVDNHGGIRFTTSGPPPPEGPCPGGENVAFLGQVSQGAEGALLSARGVTTVDCPVFGEHEFTYRLDGER